MYPQLQAPFSMIVAGPTSCGKTTFIHKLLMNLDIVDTKFDKIIWCSAETNAFPANLRKLNIVKLNGIPDDFRNTENKPTLIILDDFMTEIDSNAGLKICELFTRGSHHRNISVVLITQNIFHKGKYCRDISLNAKYLVLFKNPRDKTQFNHLARQIYPENTVALQNLYKALTQNGYSYLFIDLSQGIHDALRFRTHIFNKSHSTCYCDLKTIGKQDGVSPKTIKSQQGYTLRVERR
jgi:type IV secretory pathway VirB4 component